MEPIFNPYLPLTEYIPDGEPHVFGDRVYVYGSHDRSAGTAYCEEHYEVWSAPVSDLRDWKSEGISYLRTQDPSNAADAMQLWAPDVTRGPDGRYYLYYCFSFYPEIGVAVSDHPAGPFSFYGHVHYPPHILGGKLLQEGMVFDPAVLTDDDGRVYLYYGFAPACEKEIHFPEFTEEELNAMPQAEQEKIRGRASLVFGENSMVVELEPDMLTCREEPRVLIPGGHHTEGTGFEGHGFFEASSIRKIQGRYYFVYSSHKSHELCYATSDYPDQGFEYGGTLVSNGDIGLNGRQSPVYPLGNNHGGLVQVGDDFYIFYHRQTNGTEFSRQGCAEKVEIAEDGTIAQAEITSCGLNGKPLPASGIYPAGICCHLTDPTVINQINYMDPVMKTQVCVTQKQNQVFITRIKDQTTVGYKYFDFQEPDRQSPGRQGSGNAKPAAIWLELRGDFQGRVSISLDEMGKQDIAAADLQVSSDTWSMYEIPIGKCSGTQALYMTFTGNGLLDMKSLGFE